MKLTAFTHLKIAGKLPQKETRKYSNYIHFQVLLLLVSGRVDSFKLKDEFFKILPTAWTQTHTHPLTAFGILSLEVQPPFFKGWFPNHHYFSRGLSSSKRNHQFLKWWQRLPGLYPNLSTFLTHPNCRLRFQRSLRAVASKYLVPSFPRGDLPICPNTAVSVTCTPGRYTGGEKRAFKGMVEISTSSKRVAFF